MTSFTSASRPHRVTVSLLVLTLACGLGDQSDSPAAGDAKKPGAMVADLVERFPIATLDIDTPEIDLGTESSHTHLVSGWSFDEVDEGGNPFAWSVGDESRLRFHVGRPRPLVLRFRCYPFPAPGSPPQKLTVVLNGHFLRILTLERKNAEYEVALPQGSLVAGDNALDFYYAITYDPSVELPGVTDKRRLAVLWHWIRVGDDRTRPETDPLLRTVQIPADHRVRYLLRTPPEAVLRIEGLEASGDARLRVTLRDQEGEAREVALLEGSSTPTRLALHAGDSDFVELGLESVSGPDGAIGSVALHAPVIESVGPMPPGLLPDRRPNIIVYLIDTLRVDQLGLYGATGPYSPHIDAFARQATVFDDARAVSSWTRPSAASVLTGLLPQTHGVTHTSARLAPGAVTLAEILRSVGYQTTAFSINANVIPHFGFDQGFWQFDDLVREFNLKILHEHHASGSAHEKTDIVHEVALDFLLGGRARAPFFLYFHTMDPHAPYTANPDFLAQVGSPAIDPALGSIETITDVHEGRREASAELLNDMRMLYGGEVSRNDSRFGALVRELKRLGLYDDALIVVLSDHGEGFNEHGFLGHANTLYDESVRVPLIVKLPGQSEATARRVEAPIHQTDVLPSLLGYLGLSLSEPVDGRDLHAVLEGGAAPAPRPRIAHLDMPPFHIESVTSEGYKLVVRRGQADGSSAYELYHLASDPGEERNLASERPAVRDRLAALLPGSAEPRWTVPTQPLERMEERLRALGYVE